MSEETKNAAALAPVEDERKGKPSASGMHRIQLCPASWRAEKLYPQEETTADAAAGTRLHKHMEDGTDPIDADELDAVEWCRAKEKRLVDSLLPGEGEVQCVREQRMWGCERAFSCKADAIFVRGGAALVVDYKFGRLPVSAPEENLQLVCAAITALENLHGVETVYCAILAPFVSRKDAPCVRYERKVLPQMQKFVRGIIAAAESENAPARPSEDACRYCKAKASCPACSQLVSTVTAAALLESWATLPVEARRKLYDVAKLAEKWAAAVLAKVKSDLKNGEKYDGLTLKPGASQFAVTDASAAFSALAAQYGISADEFVACCKVNISDVDKLLYAKKNDGKEKGDPARIKQDDIKKMVRETLASCGKTTQKDSSIGAGKEGN